MGHDSFASSGATLGYGPATDVVRDPSNASTLYATTDDDELWCVDERCSDLTNYKSPRVVKSVDGGSTWSEVMNGFRSPARRCKSAGSPSPSHTGRGWPEAG